MAHGGNVWQGGDPAVWQDHSANLRPEGMPKWVRAALERAMDDAIYYPQVSMERASQALAEFLGLGVEYVLPTAGGISAIELATKDARELIAVTPCFSEYAYLAERRGIPVKRAGILKGDGSIDTSLDNVLPLLKEGSSVRLCDPLNPVGTVFPREAIEKLLFACEAAGAILMVDEAFIDYCPGSSVRDLVMYSGNIIITGSMTKVLAIPGVRLGYLCASPEVIERLRASQLTWELNCFAERVLIELPKHREELYADAGENAARRERLRGRLEALGMRVYPSEASFLLVKAGVSAHGLAEYLRDKNILVRECTDFDGINDDRHLRLAVRTDKENERLAAVLGEAIRCAENH